MADYPWSWASLEDPKVERENLSWSAEARSIRADRGVVQEGIVMESVHERLLRELELARAELKRLDEKLQAKGEYGLGKGDPAVYQWEFNLALRQSAEQKIAVIERALERVKAGTYGICERCHEPIEAGRLEALPYTTLCSKCARLEV